MYLAGLRYPPLSAGDPKSHNYNNVGNIILGQGGHYMHNLLLARSGILIFLVLAAAVVFFWARRLCGDFAGVVAVGLLTTTPTVLAFSSVAYSDMAAAFAQTLALFAFVNWLDHATNKTSTWLGFTIALALLAKFTSLVYLPVAMALILASRWSMQRDQPPASPSVPWGRQITLALVIVLLVWWAGYRFTFGRLQIAKLSTATFQHFPAPVRPMVRRIALLNPPLPAPDLFYGLAESYVFNKEKPISYLFGITKKGGWWFFFFIELVVKSPPALLLLSSVGLVALVPVIRQRKWQPLAPAISAIAILLSTTTTNVYYGIRHIIVLFPLLAIVGGCGAVGLWGLEGKWRVPGRAAVIAVLTVQVVSTMAARRDYLAYFNALAGSDPSRILVLGCDLDCGQDLFRLSRALHARGIEHFNLAVWSSADIDRGQLPSYTLPKPYEPVTGWFAISVRARRLGDVLLLRKRTYPPGSFEWLDQYQPVEHIGKTISLYYIPDKTDDTYTSP